MVLISVVISLFIVITIIAAIIVGQINRLGMDVKSFKDFLFATINLDKLYNFATQYDNLNEAEQEVFLEEAKKIFDVFEKIPTALWEDEYHMYMEVLEKYNSIKNDKWLKGDLEDGKAFKKLVKKELYSDSNLDSCLRKKKLKKNNISLKKNVSSISSNTSNNSDVSKLKNERGSISMKLCFTVLLVIIAFMFLKDLVFRNVV